MAILVLEDREERVRWLRGAVAEVLAELAACAAVDLVRTGAVSATEE